MPSAKTKSETRLNAGAPRRARIAWRRSATRPSTESARLAPGGDGSVQWACRSGARPSARRFRSLKAARARWTASSGETPPATSCRHRSSRCCESSSTISASRAGGSATFLKRARISGPQSGMFASCYQAHGFDERLPRLLLAREDAAAVRGQPVESPPSLAGLLDPCPLDPPALLEPVEQRIERVDVEHEAAGRARLDQ